jgi:hypothetical protein
VNREQRVHRLEFHDYLAGDEKIEDKVAANIVALVLQVDSSLFGKGHTTQNEFHFHAALVDAFEKARSYRLVDVYRRADNLLGYIVLVHCLCVSASPRFRRPYAATASMIWSGMSKLA